MISARQEWSDGLPVVPPTPDRVTAMLSATSLRPSQVIGESYVIAENEEDSPWEPLHVDKGFAVGQSTVTVMAAAGPRQVLNQLSGDAEGVLTTIADDMRITAGITWQSYFVVLLGGEHMEIMKRAGWSKKDVRSFLFESTMTSYAHLKRTNRAALPISHHDEIRMRPLVKSEEHIWVLPAGGMQGPFSCYIPGWMDDFWSYATIKEVRHARTA